MSSGHLSHISGKGRTHEHLRPHAQHREGSSPGQGRAAADRRLVAGRELPLGRADLPDGQPAAPGAAAAGAREAAAARALGHHARAQLRLRPPEPGDRGPRPGDDVRDRPRPRRSRAGGCRLAGGHLQRGLPERRAGRGRDAPAVHAVLLPGRHPEPRRARDARLDPRGRRARLLPVARVRRGLRQPRPRRGGRRRGRRGRDRPPGDELALDQVRRPAPGRRRAADPAPERLQDRQPHGARPHPRRRADLAAARLRPHAVRRGGVQTRGDAPGVRRHAGPLPRRDPRHPARGPDVAAAARRRGARGR